MNVTIYAGGGTGLLGGGGGGSLPFFEERGPRAYIKAPLPGWTLSLQQEVGDITSLNKQLVFNLPPDIQA